jgi:ATP-dependent Clp protease ATP-binding subunit ClpC
LTVSPRIKNVLELAFADAQELGHGYVGPEHLLLGLLEESEGMASDLLRKYGLTAESLRQKIVKVVGKGAQEGRVESASATPQLDKYSRDLSKLAREGALERRRRECPTHTFGVLDSAFSQRPHARTDFPFCCIHG